MATRKKSSDEIIPTQAAKTIQKVGMNDEVSKSFLEYSMSVVYSRALPDIQDGFKPVQRRIMFSMFQDGLFNEKNYVKSAKPVASTMGTLHPHGDSSIYSALCRMAVPYVMNIPLISPYGNFGDATGSPPAASRYTECKLSKEAMFVLSELREHTVPMRPNYSGDLEEPVYLPCSFPNLLINGSFGVAVGFACNLPPHNPGEVMNAAKLVLKNRNATLDQVMKVLPGPDFPTGALIVGMDEVRQAYETGRGVFKMRARCTVTATGRGKHQIVFDELPYGSNTEKILTKIKDGMKEGKFAGIADAQDLTDKDNDMRFVVDVKAGANPQAVLLELYKNTPLEDSFGVNNTVLVDGRPKTVGLMELLNSFLDHRTRIVLNRSTYRKDKRAARLHLVEGLLKALANIDEVIRIIRAAPDASTAQTKLMAKFKITDIQADHILGIPLRRLTKFDQIALNEEKAELEKEIAELESIINDEDVRNALIASELESTRKAIARPRRSTLVDGTLAEAMEEAKATAKTVSAEIADEPTTVFLTRDGRMVQAKRAPNAMLSSAATTTRGKFVAVSNKGRAWRIDTLHVPTKAGEASKVLPERLESGEKLVAVTPVELPAGATGGIAMGTKSGVVKICSPSWPVRSDDFTVFKMEGDDEILAARWVDDVTKFEFAFMTNESNLLRFGADKVRPQGLTGGGVAGIKIPEGGSVVSFDVVSEAEAATAVVITVADSGRGKMTPFAGYPAKGRATGGVRTLKFLRGDNEVKFGFVGDQFTLLGPDGTGSPELPKADPRRDGSGKEMAVPVR